MAPRRSTGGERENILVAARVRPNIHSGVNDDDEQECVTVNGNRIIVNDRNFDYDQVLDNSSSQADVFERIGKHVVMGCLDGFNGTIFAYGQTGSGKTFTMLGAQSTLGSLVENMQGVIPRACDYIFDHLNESGSSFKIKCSMAEIYNEAVYDLLDPAAKAKPVREDNARDIVFVEGQEEKIIGSPQEALAVLEEGNRNRRVAETSMNRESSRSHAIFTLNIEVVQEHEGGIKTVRKSRLNLVDLAGSERQRDTQAAGERLKEASQINKSLSTLGNVINSLTRTSSSGRHVPYRDSKLTFLLRDSLGGNTRTALIATINPSSKSFGETLSTLQFAQRAKLIQNRTKKNEGFTGSVAELQAEIKRLKTALEKFEQGDGIAVMLPAGANEPLAVVAANALENHQEAEREKVTLTRRLESEAKQREVLEKKVRGLTMQLKMAAAAKQHARGGDAEALASDVSKLSELIATSVQNNSWWHETQVIQKLTHYQELLGELERLQATYPIKEDHAQVVKLKTQVAQLEHVLKDMLVRENRGGVPRTPTRNPADSPARGAGQSPRARGTMAADIELSKVRGELEQRIKKLEEALEEQKRLSLTREDEFATAKAELLAQRDTARRDRDEMADNMEVLQEQLSLLTNRIQDVQLDGLNAGLSATSGESSVQDFAQKLGAMNQELQSLREANSDLMAKNKTLGSTVRTHRDEYETIKARCTSLQALLDEKDRQLTDALAAHQVALQAKVEEVDTLTTRVETAERDLETAQARESLLQDTHEEQLKGLRASAMKMEHTLSSANSRIEALETDLESKEERVLELTDENTVLDEEKKFLQNRYDNLQASLSSTANELRQAREAVSTLEERLAEEIKNANKLREQAAQDEGAAAELQRLATLEEELQQELREQRKESERLADRLAAAQDELQQAHATYQAKSQDNAALVADLTSKYQDVQAKLQVKNESYTELQATLETTQAALHEHEQKLDAKDAQLSHLQSELSRLQVTMDADSSSHEAKQEALLDELTTATAQVKEFESQRDTLQANVTAVREELTNVKQQLADALAAKDALQCKLEVTQQDFEKTQEEVGALREQLKAADGTSDAVQSLREELNAKSEKLRELAQQNDKVVQHLTRSDEIRVSLYKEVAPLKKEVSDLKDQLAQAREEATQQQKELLAANDDRQALTSEVERLQRQLTEARAAGDSKASEIEQLNEQIKNFRKVADHATLISEAIEDHMKTSAGLKAEKEEYRRRYTETKKKLSTARSDIRLLEKDKKDLDRQVQDARRERDELLGHSNPKQKIQYTAQMKEQYNQLQRDFAKLQADYARLQKESKCGAAGTEKENGIAN